MIAVSAYLSTWSSARRKLYSYASGVKCKKMSYTTIVYYLFFHKKSQNNLTRLELGILLFHFADVERNFKVNTFDRFVLKFRVCCYIL